MGIKKRTPLQIMNKDLNAIETRDLLNRRPLVFFYLIH